VEKKGKRRGERGERRERNDGIIRTIIYEWGIKYTKILFLSLNAE